MSKSLAIFLQSCVLIMEYRICPFQILFAAVVGVKKRRAKPFLVATWAVEREFIRGRVGRLCAKTINRRNFEGVLDARLDAVQNAVVDLHRAKRTRFANINILSGRLV